MANVVEVKQNPKKPENAFVKFDDGTDAWCPDFEKASKLVLGQPLPSDWRQDTGDFGPRVFPPGDNKGGGGKAAFRNTKEGFLLEQESIHRSVALTQAVAYTPDAALPPDVLVAADLFYEWLRETAGRTAPAAGGDGAPSPSSPPAPTSGPGRGGEDLPGSDTSSSAGGAGASPAGGCIHPETNRKVTASGKVRCALCGAMLP